MRIVVSLLLFLAGCGCIAYSYIGSLVAFAGEVEQTAGKDDGAAAFMIIVDFLLRGEMTQLTSFLYGGVFLISVAIVNLIVRSKPNDERNSV